MDAPERHYSVDADMLPAMIRHPAAGAGRNGPISTISNGQLPNTNGNMARRKSFDINQTLTYRKVMERVIKRFLLHKQREEQDEIREGDFEELKQDIQMLRFEMMNRLDETRDDLAKNSVLLNEGVLVVGELLSSLTRETNPLLKENFHTFKNKFYSTMDRIRLIDSGIDSNDTLTTSNSTSGFSMSSMPNLGNHASSEQTLSTSNSAPTLSSDKIIELNVNPIEIMRHLSAVQITLTNIVEENEELENIKTPEHDEEEVEARHISTQTSPANNDGEKSRNTDTT